MSNGLKFFLIFLIIVVFGAVGYFLLSGENIPSFSGATSSPLQTSTGEPVSGIADQSVPEIDADRVGQEFVSQLLNIRSIKLRDDIFSNPAFVSLIDYTIELIQLGNEGRDNPFAPFGVEGQDPSMGQFMGEGALEGSFPIIDSGGSMPSFGPGQVVPVQPQTPQEPVDDEFLNTS